MFYDAFALRFKSGVTLIHRYVGTCLIQTHRKGFQDLLEKDCDIYEWHAVHCFVFAFTSWKLSKCIFLRQGKHWPAKCSCEFISSHIWTDILALYSLSIIQQNSTHCLILFCFVWYSYRILYKFSKANNSVKIISLDTLMSKCTMNTPSFSRYFLTRFKTLARVYFIDYTE